MYCYPCQSTCCQHISQMTMPQDRYDYDLQRLAMMQAQNAYHIYQPEMIMPIQAGGTAMFTVNTSPTPNKKLLLLRRQA
jgi:hypothetical protein